MRRHMLASLALAIFAAMAMPLTAFAYDDYPSKWKNAKQDSLVDTWGMYNRECVSFVAWCLSSRNGYTINRAGRSWNAGRWKENARAAGVLMDENPVVGSVAWWRNVYDGIPHVAWVSEVNGDWVTVEEYNYYRGVYSERTIEKSNPSGYIHFQDIPDYKTPVILNDDRIWVSAEAVLSLKEDQYIGFSEGLAPVRGSNGFYGYIDENGIAAIPYHFTEANLFGGGVAHVVDLEGNSRFIDKSQTTLAMFDTALEARHFSDGLIYAKGVGYLDKLGNLAFRFNDDYAEWPGQFPTFSEGLAVVADPETGLHSYMDTSGSVAISDSFSYASGFKDGVAWVQKDGLWCSITKSGEISDSFNYPDLSKYQTHKSYTKPPFVEGIAIIGNSEEFGYANLDGNVIVAPGKYEPCRDGSLANFSEGFAVVMKNGNYGVIDKTGKEVVALTLDYISDFNGGLALFRVDGKVGVLKIAKE
ncbi:MAG: WG repeat-containing protein [Clostridiales bacterium]|nr:WG repeat-containing protein [Clostridiales bacterium]MDR2751380.1 WG repeat-containing protein [Clostridiales bacterium]